MTPVSVLQQLLKVNKPVATLLLGGLGVLAAAAVAVSWIGDNPNALNLAWYLLGFAFLASIIVYIVSNQRMCAVLGWVLTASFVLFLTGLVDSALQYSGRLPMPACYVRILWEAPKHCEARLFPVIKVEAPSIGADHAAWQPRDGGPERIWKAQAPAPYDGPVYLHRASVIPAAQMVSLARSLVPMGFKIEDPARGGEVVAAMPGNNEVRFFKPINKADAIRLARALNTLRPSAPFVVRDFTRAGLIAQKGLLEIWVSR